MSSDKIVELGKEYVLGDGNRVIPISITPDLDVPGVLIACKASDEQGILWRIFSLGEFLREANPIPA